MIVFPRAPRVAKGDLITSRQHFQLADSFNARLRSGLGDPTFRLFFVWLSLVRQIRNPDSSFNLFPPLAEFFEVFQTLDPRDAEWPVSDPGEPEGTNLASFMGAFVFGNEAIDLDSEDIRLTDPAAGGIPLWPDGHPPSTPAEFWLLGKLQRGAYDPATGALGSPAFHAAREHYKLKTSTISEHGNAWGGFMPVPTALGDCADGVVGPPAIAPHINYEVFFTKLTSDAVCPAGTTTSGNKCIYPGTCPGTAGDFAGLVTLPWAYYVFRVGGTVDVLDRKQFILGPFTEGGALMKTEAQMIPRMLARFANEFRGSDSQRADENYEVATNGFPFQRFLSSQYLLAPAIGQEVSGEITPEYPLFKFSGKVVHNAGTFGHYIQQGGDTRKTDPTANVSAFYAQADKLAASCTIQLMDDDDVLGSITLTPAESTGIVVLDEPSKPEKMRVKLGSDARFTDASGTIEVEVAELYDYKPEVHDLYLLLRTAGGVISGEFDTLDGRGIDQSASKEIGDAYFENACIVNAGGHAGLPGQFTAINQNAVFDAARRWSQMVRCIPGRYLVGYEVDSAGRSICYFKRYAYGLDRLAPSDLFLGIAPGRLEISSGALRWGITYEVRDDQIVYDGQTFLIGETFEAKEGKMDFSGPGHVFEHDGIYHEAPPQGFTNEWLMGAQLKVYHWSESSVWKPDAYSWYFALSNRCQFRSTYAESHDDLTWQFSYGQELFIAPEAPSGYNYVHGTNPSIFPEHYKSCRIYEPDPEIESAIVLIESGEEIVKLTFKTRFHSTLGETGGATATVPRDASTWDWTALDAEPFRTMENGIRQFIGNYYYGRHCTRGDVQPGNSGYNSPVWSDDVYGACYPHFLFTKLIPIPYRETPIDNTTQERHDTPTFHDTFAMMELYLRAMCEGCVDKVNTEALACFMPTEALVDFTFENLMFQASGNTMQWFNLLPSTLREDRPQGFGPPPNTDMHAETFNLFAAAVDLLDRFRVMLPVKTECRGLHYTDDKEVTGLDIEGAPATCFLCVPGPGSAQQRNWVQETPMDATTLTVDDGWADCSNFTAVFFSTVRSDACGSDGKYLLRSQRDNFQWRMALDNPDALYAIPETWRDMLETNFGIIARIDRDVDEVIMELVDAVDADSCGIVTQFWGPRVDGKYLRFRNIGQTFAQTCELLSTGTIVAPPLGSNAFNIGCTAAIDSCNGGAQNNVLVTLIVTNETAFVHIPLVDPSS